MDDELNELYIYCAKCGNDITLHAQYSDPGGIICGDCNEKEE